MRALLLMRVCTSAVHFLLLECVFGLSSFTSVCHRAWCPVQDLWGGPSQCAPTGTLEQDSPQPYGGGPWSAGWPVTWTTAHTQQPPPWRLKTEALFSMLAEGGLQSLGAPDFTGLKASYTVPLQANEPQRVSYLKMPKKKFWIGDCKVDDSAHIKKTSNADLS